MTKLEILNNYTDVFYKEIYSHPLRNSLENYNFNDVKIHINKNRRDKEQNYKIIECNESFIKNKLAYKISFITFYPNEEGIVNIVYTMLNEKNELFEGRKKIIFKEEFTDENIYNIFKSVKNLFI